MRIAVEVPIKARSSVRIPNKNFTPLAGKPLCYWLLGELFTAPVEWDIYIDSEEYSVFRELPACWKQRFDFHKRDPWYASDGANGNHLLSQFAVMHPEYDIYVQAFVTAVTLPMTVIRDAVDGLARCVPAGDDSILLVTEETGWFWRGGVALNYEPGRPNGLPRSQDATVLKETTGLYAITHDALFETGCRVGQSPLLYRVDRQYALDVDTPADLAVAERALRDDEVECGDNANA